MMRNKFMVKSPGYYNYHKVYIYDNNHVLLSITQDKKDGGLLLYPLGTYARRYRYDVDKKKDQLKVIGSDLVWE